MYTIKKSGSLYQVVTSNDVVQFSSLQRGNCKQWILHATETKEEREKRFL